MTSRLTAQVVDVFEHVGLANYAAQVRHGCDARRTLVRAANSPATPGTTVDTLGRALRNFDAAMRLSDAEQVRSADRAAYARTHAVALLPDD